MSVFSQLGPLDSLSLISILNIANMFHSEKLEVELVDD